MAAAGVAPAGAAGPPQADVICLLDSDEDQPQPQQQRSSSGRGAGPSRQAPAGTAGRQQQPQPQQRRASAAGAGGGGGDVIDLTSDSPPEGDGELQIVRSTVQRAQRGPMRGVKRPRPSPQQQQVAQLSPMKAMLVQAARAAAALPPPEPEPEGPKCGICMEPMGGSEGRQMGSGTCGHVYCYDCLVEAVRAQKKCPTCRKGMQLRSIHKVFVNFS